jgi:peptide deformylase
MSNAKKARPAPEGLVVVNYPDPILKKRAVEVERLDEWVKGVIARMKTLMVEHEGVGLAAPQVGLGLRLFVWSPTGKGGDAQAIINPVISEERGEEEGEEGCLSLPDIRTKVARFKTVRVEGTDENGQPVALDLVDYPARIVQHETDHLDGILILDRMSAVARIANRKKIRDLEERWEKRDTKG